MHIALGPSLWRRPVIPLLLALLAALSIIPVGQAALELIIHRVTVADLVDRRAYSDNLVSLDGYTLLVPFVAAPPDDPPDADLAYHWYALSGELGSQRLLLMRSAFTVEALRTRTLIARLVDDPAAVEGTVEMLGRRGVTAPAGSPAARLLVEVARRSGPIRDISSLQDVSGLPSGEVIRLRLRTESGMATCVVRNACDARALAAGIGSWDNVAIDPEGGGWAILRTSYPPSQVPFDGVGRQERDAGLVDELLGSLPGRALLGRAFVLEAAFVDHDPSLPIDHLWLGPLLFTGLGLLLLFGQRVGYPRFVVQRVSGAPHQSAPSAHDEAVLTCRASGRISPPGASPFEVTDRPATISAAPDGANRVVLGGDGDERVVIIPRALGGLGMIEIGVILEAWQERPALRVGWFGSGMLLAFDDADAREAAVRLLRR